MTYINIRNIFLFLTIVNGSAFAAVSHKYTSCDSRFSRDCDECFINERKLKLGEGVLDVFLDFKNRPTERYIFEDENKTVFRIKPFYTNGELEQNGINDFKWNEKIFFRDAKGDAFATAKENTTSRILSASKDFFIKFAKLSDDVKRNGTSHPLFEYSFTINYYNNDKKWKKEKITSCTIAYPDF